MTTRKALPAVLAVAVVLLATCSSTTNGSTTTTPGATTTTTAPDSSTTVTIANFAFDPSTLTITVGTTVTWVNSDSTTHTVTADGGEFDSGDLAPGATFQFTFEQIGDFTYHCSLHPTMQGTISVKGSA